MKRYPLAARAGITQKAIADVLGDQTEEALFKFLHGDVDLIYRNLPKPNSQMIPAWESAGKRYVHLEDARFVANYFLRNGIKPANRRALVLCGKVPSLACIPWAMSGMAYTFDAYEKDVNIHNTVRYWRELELEKIKSTVPKVDYLNLSIVEGDCLEIKNKEYGIIDLDFCNNHLRTIESRKRILSLVDRIAPTKQPFVLRTTAHIGRTNNSREDVDRHIELFEDALRTGDCMNRRFRIRAHNESPYQSSLPMTSLIWILEEKGKSSKNKAL